MTRASLILTAMLLGQTPLASAQPTTLVQIAHANEPLFDGRSQLQAVRFPNGELLTTQVAQQRPGALVSLVRYDASGHEVVRLDAAPSSARGSAPFVEDDELTELIALPDGTAIVVGHSWGEQAVIPFLFRVARDGEILWRTEANAPSRANDNYYAGFSIVVGDQDELILHGLFKGGSFQLPGARRWNPRRQFNPFLARLDLDTGRVLWAKRVPNSGETIIHDGVLSIISVNVPRTRRGQAAPTFSELRVDRYDVSGRQMNRSRDRLPGAVAPRGAAALRDGFALVTETCREQDRHRRCLTEGILYIYDGSGARIASHTVPPWSVLAGPTPGAPLRVIGPSALRRERVGTSDRIMTDAVDVLTFRDPTAAPARGRINVPQTRFVSIVDATLFGGQSLPEGIVFYAQSALLEAGVAGNTLLFVADRNFAPIESLPTLLSDPYPEPSPPVARGRLVNPF